MARIKIIRLEEDMALCQVDEGSISYTKWLRKDEPLHLGVFGPQDSQDQGVELTMAEKFEKDIRDEDKPKYKSYLSPLAMLAYGKYMLKHQVQPDGSIRDADNWKKGIPKEQYAESLLRHYMDLWLHLEGFGALAREDWETALCGIMFNSQGLLHEFIKELWSCAEEDKEWPDSPS